MTSCFPRARLVAVPILAPSIGFEAVAAANANGDAESKCSKPHVMPGHHLALQSMPDCKKHEIWRTSDPRWPGTTRNAAPETDRALRGGTLGDCQILLSSSNAVSIRTIRVSMDRFDEMQIPELWILRSPVRLIFA